MRKIVLLAGVITGDIVDSGKLSKEEHKNCLISLDRMIEKLANSYGTKGDVFRGDEFQLFVPDYWHSLRYAIVLRLCIMFTVKNADARVSLGIGQYSDLNDELRKTAKGEAFELSGRGLGNIRDERLKISLANVDVQSSSIGLLIRHLDSIVTGLSQKQAEVLIPKLLYPNRTQTQLSDETGIPRRTISNRLQAANSVLLIDTIEFIEKELKGIFDD
ncbi:hypothetical protein [Vibrio parahaemolyticus]|uniref:hypothetical protein n=1 Tax=Vibrio parahaemolyticus TaxID=670 RepID=UPI000470DD44|nr:hypothetical protein [Vibrio parahaemolyticus]MDG2639221.1 hypothetical protein [Vibrio parahaemolyticus]